MLLLITARQAAKVLGVSTRRVSDLSRNGQLPVHSTTPGGYRRYDLEAVRRVAEQRVTAKTARPAATVDA